MSQITQPSYLEDVTEPESVILIQSAGGIHSPPKYEHYEQFLCSIDGLIQNKLIPHVFRQEVYAGSPKTIVDPTAPKDETNQAPKQDICEPNESPVNFLEPDYNLYPLFNDVLRKYSVILHEGDCVYIPAFYFHQFIARPPNQPEREGRKPAATAIILRYKP